MSCLIAVTLLSVSVFIVVFIDTVTLIPIPLVNMDAELEIVFRSN
jgi:hypothetical protein